MDKEKLYVDAVNKYLDNICVPETKVFSGDEALSYYKEIPEGPLVDAIDIVIDRIEHNEKTFLNADSAFYLAKLTTEAEICLVSRGCFDTVNVYINFLKRDLFRFLIIDKNIGYRLVRGIYRGGRISNAFVKDNPMYFDVFKKVEEYKDYEIDCIHLTKVFAAFFLKMEEKYQYSDEEGQNNLRSVCEKYEQFRSYVDNDREQHRDQAEILFKENGAEWPALSYSLAEFYSRYDTRLRMAKNISDSPQIVPMRRCEKEGHEKELKKAAQRKSLIKAVICLAILGFVIYKVYSFFAGHPGRQGAAALIFIAVLFFNCLGDDPLFWLFFFWWRRD